ncbi:mycofactocin biosynthesis glycosyltransferase MftF [Actinospongicola halichondriae]|uniref:mycofactocin biosynthesis glycosyltransferase MftF n=1 Tax=Actinospongicola halichondriae TaxID=3236844 RepID=UPI003D43A5E7
MGHLGIGGGKSVQASLVTLSRLPPTRSDVPEGLPESISLRLDHGTRRSDAGRTFIGGSPLRVLRLTDAGARVADRLAAGEAIGPDAASQTVARRLLDAGLAHPVCHEVPAMSVTVVVPVRDHAAELASLVASLGSVPVVVVDDGSSDPAAVVRAAGEATVIRHERSRGPAAARNSGWRATSTDLVAFVDADITMSTGWLEPLVAHFSDPAVGAVAPRVRGRATGHSAIDRYERHRSPLDLGPEPARVVPRGRVSYLPTATVVFRRSVLETEDGFDEALRFGEDVDLIWRVAEDCTVRYEPAVEVEHDNRPTWPALLRQRMQYGSSAAHLDQRHPGQVAPVEVNAWSLAAWTMAALGGRRGVAAGALTATASAALLVPDLRDRVDDPITETARLAGVGNLWAGRWLASATVRAWFPVALVAASRSTRARRALAVAAVAPALFEWRDRHPDLGPVAWTAARVADDLAYCVGVWRGCAQVGSWRSLRPRLTGIPGLTRR